MKSPLLLLLIPLGIGCYNGDAEAASKETICASALGTSVVKNVVPRCFVWVKKNYFPGDWRFVHYARRGYFSDGPWAHPAMAS